MSLNPETITQIQAMLQADPALLAQLQAETELAGVVAVITKAATAQGLDINEADLMSHLEAEQLRTKTATLSDAELEHVAGGGIGNAIFASVVGLGVACAVASIIVAVSKDGKCGKALANFDPTKAPLA